MKIPSIKVGGDDPEVVEVDGEMTESPSRGLLQLQSSQAAMRAATKWLVAAAAAVGAVVVGGLQLSTLPSSNVSRAIALVGVAAALLGVALILHRAGGVLAAGYTTLGELTDLDTALQDSDAYGDLRYTEAQAKRLRERIDKASHGDASWRERYVAVAKCLYLEKIRLPIQRSKRRRVKDEGVSIDRMLHYLNRDATFFTNGLATHISGLYRGLETADEEILKYRSSSKSSKSQLIPGSNEKTQDGMDPRLEYAEWKRRHLETAASTLVAFANQKIIEQRFRRVQRTLLSSGLLIFGGAAAFAWTLSGDTAGPLAISQPTPVEVHIVSNAFPGCPAGTTLVGTAVGGTWEEAIVVLEKMGSCPYGNFAPETTDAFVVPRIPLDSNTPAPVSP